MVGNNRAGARVVMLTLFVAASQRPWAWRLALLATFGTAAIASPVAAPPPPAERVRAAQAHVQQGELREALALLQAASAELDAGAPVIDRVLVVERLGEILGALGDKERAEGMLENAIGLARDAGLQEI